MSGLKEAMDFFDLNEGIIVTLNHSDAFVENGKQVRVIPANQWLNPSQLEI